MHLSVPSGRYMLLLQVCCCGPGGQQNIDQLLHGRQSVSAAWHAAANTGS